MHTAQSDDSTAPRSPFRRGIARYLTEQTGGEVVYIERASPTVCAAAVRMPAAPRPITAFACLTWIDAKSGERAYRHIWEGAPAARMYAATLRLLDLLSPPAQIAAAAAARRNIRDWRARCRRLGCNAAIEEGDVVVFDDFALTVGGRAVSTFIARKVRTAAQKVVVRFQPIAPQAQKTAPLAIGGWRYLPLTVISRGRR